MPAKDPMGEAGGLNLYGYVGGDPINGIDPFGLWEWSDFNPFQYLDASQWGKWIYKAAVGEGRRPHDPHSNMGMRNEMGMGADDFDGRSGAELASMIGGAVPAALLGAGLNFAPGAAAANAGGKASGSVCAIGNLEGKVLRVASVAKVHKAEVAALSRFYPEHAGFAGAVSRRFLMPGQTIDRYGGSGYSRFFSPQGTPSWARSLPPGTAAQPLRTFRVVKPFEVQSGTVAPWFNQPGGGVQHASPVKLEVLLKHGVIIEISP